MSGITTAPRRYRRLAALSFVSFFVAAEVHAHIRMTAPTNRYPIPDVEDGSFLKDGPCGGGNDSRTSDSTRISTFVAGETITVEWHETVHHDSHYRIALDLDGQDDFVDQQDEYDIVDPPVLPILLDGIADKSSDKDSFSVQVTLPDVECDACTLQLVQYMYGRNDPFYYQCADIVIQAATDSGGPTLPPESGMGGDANSPSMTGDTGGSVSMAAGGTTEVPPNENQSEGGPDDDGDDEPSGCQMSARGRGKLPLVMFASLLVLGWWRQRRGLFR